MDSPTDFTVEGIEDGGKLVCIVTSPSGIKTEAPVTADKNNKHKVLYTPIEEGMYNVELLYDGVTVPGSPFTVHVKRGSDPSKVKVIASRYFL